MVLEKQSRLSSIVILLFFWAMCLISPSSMLVVALIFSVFHVHTYENFVCNVHSQILCILVRDVTSKAFPVEYMRENYCHRSY